MSEWKPIDSAPTNRPILVKSDFVFDSKSKFNAVWSAVFNGYEFEAYDGEPLYDATHWADMPE